MTPPARPADDVRSLAALPFYVAARHNRPAHLCRCEGDHITSLSSVEVLEHVRDLSLGLQALGVSHGDRVGIVCESRPEWHLADLAILSGGAVTVPVYPTLSAEQTAFILEDAGASIVFVSDAAQLEKMRTVAAELAAIRAVIVAVPPPRVPEPIRPGLFILTFADVAASGRRQLQQDPDLAERFERRARAVDPSDVATIIYTSGTTGTPKGVVLTHDNIMSNVRATNAVLQVTSDDEAMSFLPLSHTFERTALYLYMHAGARVTFTETLQTIARDFIRVAPTVMAGAPRVYEKFHRAVLDHMAGEPRWRRRLFDWAMALGMEIGRARLDGCRPRLMALLQAPLADALVWRKVRARTGGRMRAMVSGSAPLSRATAEFFYAVRMPIIEGYGLTESAPVICVNPLHRPKLGSVGPTIPGVEIRIAEDGEILARGPNIMRGYWGRPDDTAAVLTDGWLRTGDIGEIDGDGYLTITDRKKDIIVTSGGKNIAPQPIQQRLKASPLVADAIVIGDRRNFPAALIVPDFAAIEAALHRYGAPSGTREQLAARADVQALFQVLVDDINVHLAQYERIKRFALLPSEMTVEGGELTPTLKLRRSVVEARWASEIEQLYATREPVLP